MTATNDTHCFALAGLPGSGKSTVADIIVDELTEYGEDATSTEVSDFVRTRFEAQEDESVTDNELGRWAAEQKAENGDGFFARQMVQHWTGEDSPHVVISGLRSPEEAEAVRDGFGDNATIVAVWTLPDIRFERKYGEVPSTDHPQWETFTERNERETHEWGCAEFFTDEGPSDYVIPNNSTLEELEGKVQAIVRNDVTDESLMAEMFKTAPFPNDTATRAAQYL